MTLPIATRRTFRVSLTVALSLAFGYAMALSVPFLAPILALMIASPPAPPMGFKKLVSLIIVVSVTTGIGLLLIPMLLNYPLSAVLIVAVGLYFSNYLAINLGKGMVGTFLMVGLTLIPLAGMIDFGLAVLLVQSLVLGIAFAVLCHRVVYLLFPEDPAPKVAATPTPVGADQSSWAALRAAMIVLPSFLLALTNPAAFMPIIMKSIMLGQQGSVIDARHAGRELLGSTFLGCVFAILVWIGLDLVTTLWMYFLWILLFSTYFMAKFYQVIASRFPPSFWLNVAVTMLILLGSAVQDSANGKDVYQAIAVRMTLFIAVTLYAWAAIFTLEHWRARNIERRTRRSSNVEYQQ
ncbi:MAG: DUF2955 domain-containing protein [Alphaproteobacteria bacterium]|nr:MAG: DUF2955 domain-containing protein [Alphaproteobacteria bacterium]